MVSQGSPKDQALRKTRQGTQHISLGMERRRAPKPMSTTLQSHSPRFTAKHTLCPHKQTLLNAELRDAPTSRRTTFTHSSCNTGDLHTLLLVTQVYKPLLHGTQIYKPLLRVTQIYKPLLHITQVYRPLLHVIQVYKPLLLVTQVYKPLLHVTQIYKPLLC